MPWAIVDAPRRHLSEVPLDTVVDGEVYGPCREVAENGGSKPAIHAAKAVMLENVFDGRWGQWTRRGQKNEKTVAHREK